MTMVTDKAVKPIAELLPLAAKGMLFSYWAERNGDETALLSPRGNRSFRTLEANANRLHHHLHEAGLRPGDAVAMLCGNIPEFIETYLACLRGGLRLTPVNWHLAPAEAAYIFADCEAKAWIVQGDFLHRVRDLDGAGVLTRLTTGPATDGFAGFAETIAACSPEPPADPVIGRMMLYTSGTTGKPKGVVRKAPLILPPQRGTELCDYRDGDLNLLCGPAYHGGPMTFDIAFPLSSGIPILMMERFDASQALVLIERYRVTHTHMVATMFQRLLALPEAERQAADVSSLRRVFHGAAPTPPEVKQRMIDWFGPVLHEYYAATEASPGVGISSEEWLRKRGSVGKVPDPANTRILDDDGNPCPPGVVGTISFRRDPASTPEYFKAEDKNRAVFAGEFYTVGDLGYIDEDGFLFLTGRSADIIISGGVNIYPQEIDNALLLHDAVQQACTVGVPDAEWGEAVHSVIVLREGIAPSDELADELRAHARANLASYKVPRTFDFAGDIPFSEAGKVQRDAVRSRFWPSGGKSI